MRKKRSAERAIEDMWEEFSSSLLLMHCLMQRKLSPQEEHRLRVVFFAGSAALYELVNAMLMDDDVTPDAVYAFRMRIEAELMRFAQENESAMKAMAGQGGTRH